MVAAADLAVEHVDVVNPNIGVIRIERYSVVHGTHDAQIAELNALRISHQEAKTVDGGILTDAFDGDIQFTVGPLSFDLDAFGTASESIGLPVFHQSQHSHSQRRGDISLLIGVQDGLKTGECAAAQPGTDGLGIVLVHVDDHRS